MRKLMFMVFIILMASGIYGCASIVSSGPKTFPIMSQPDGADFEIIDSNTNSCILKAKTPYTAILKRDSGYFKKASYLVKFTKDGYLPHEETVIASINGWYFGNILFGGLIGILIVDPATGAMWQIDDDNLSVKLAADNVQNRESRAKAINTELTPSKWSDF